MRLSQKERTAIRTEVRRHDPNAVVLLFGSRVHDTSKGGDIDLLVESSSLDFQAKIEILAAIKAEIGDQKIDLLITKNRLTDQDPFIKIISKQAIEIWTHRTQRLFLTNIWYLDKRPRDGSSVLSLAVSPSQ